MPEFRSLDDIAKHIQSIQGQQTVLGNTNVKLSLKEAANLLEGFLRDEINTYLMSYEPTVYNRTGHWLSSIRVSEPTQIGNQLQIEIYFDDALANHPSIFNGEDGYVPWLYEVGWHWGADKTHRIYRLSDFEGIHYIKNAVHTFNMVNKWGFKITVEHGNERYI